MCCILDGSSMQWMGKTSATQLSLRTAVSFAHVKLSTDALPLELCSVPAVASGLLRCGSRWCFIVAQSSAHASARWVSKPYLVAFLHVVFVVQLAVYAIIHLRLEVQNGMHLGVCGLCT